ncbi:MULTISPECIES: alpha/beta hydrolase [unclassified Cyanobium]|uniref:alpha/beta hydrolase n=1 Tax=unclassified Cyanobium TaxID=2627006 RepID=UPI0020CC5E4A|nr:MULTISPECIES: alpha/beta hydrolase [unclassified Cyanobium]MCP9833591.1 alpha/beta hydrolase [Cyanobium sp. La Preciosa 7G6]MCP9936356.1 alpha/beta hydrolase [Cyanobium sp. Aljojuca 7A6]
MPVSHRRRQLKGLLASLLIAVPGLVPAAMAAEVLELRFDGLELPVNLEQLDGWARSPGGRSGGGGDLAVWLDLLDPRSRQDLKILLRAPLLRDTSFGQQLLDSWTGSQMLARLGDLLTTSEGRSTTAVLQTTLRRMLETRQDVSTIGLLRALPVQRLSLQLDGLYDLALQWRQQIDLQRQALRRLQALALPERRTVPFAFGERTSLRPRRQLLAVAHRSQPLPLEIWPALAPANRPWLLMMPGLGGNADQFGWLASELAERGWPVVVIQHPGSDGPALKAALDGQRPPPGAETLAIRLADITAVLAAQRRGDLPVQGKGVVLLGHSMGGLSALLAAGVVPEPGLSERCRKALDRLPIANPSRLLQCQLSSTELPERSSPPADLRGLVLLNGFGSLLWPRRGLASLGVPVLMVGGSLDLVTPPLEEQLRLFLQGRDPRSRLVMVEGGSHFSPVRLMPTDEVLFRLDEELVGVDPARVQSALLRLTTEYLHTLEQPLLLPAQRRVQQGVTLDVLDAAAARRWKAGLKP